MFSTPRQLTPKGHGVRCMKQINLQEVFDHLPFRVGVLCCSKVTPKLQQQIFPGWLRTGSTPPCTLPLSAAVIVTVAHSCGRCCCRGFPNTTDPVYVCNLPLNGCSSGPLQFVRGQREQGAGTKAIIWATSFEDSDFSSVWLFGGFFPHSQGSIFLFFQWFIRCLA